MTEKKRSSEEALLSVLVFIYGTITILFSLGSITFLNLIQSVFKATLVVILFPLGILCIASGIGIFQAKKWGKRVLIIVCPLISLVCFFLVLGSPDKMIFLTITLLLPTILFVYFLS